MNEQEMDRLDRATEALLRYRGEHSDPHLEPLDDLARRRVLDRALAVFGDPAATVAGGDRTSNRRRVGLVAAAAVLLVAAGTGVALLARSPHLVSSPRIDTAPGAIAGRSLEPGDLVITSEGASTMDLPTGIRMVLGPSSRMRLERFDPEEITVGLQGGEIVAVLDAGRGGPPFVVESPAGRVRVTGTVLRVEVGGSVVVDVLRGSVQVEDGLHEGPLEAGNRAILGNAGTSRIPGGIATAALEAARAAGLLEGIDLATSIPAPPSTHPDTPVAATEPEPGATPPPQRRASTAIRPAAAGTEELLARAAERRAARDWNESAAAYAEFWDRFPQSPKAGAALMSLAEIELTHLGRPASALARYDSYLASWPGGGLTPEAEFGRARALARLGRTAEEIAALRAFITRHPDSLLADRARLRLEALDAAVSGGDPGPEP